MKNGKAVIPIGDYLNLVSYKEQYFKLMELMSDEVEEHRRFLDKLVKDKDADYFFCPCKIDLSSICRITGWQFDEIDLINLNDALRRLHESKKEGDVDGRQADLSVEKETAKE